MIKTVARALAALALLLAPAAYAEDADPGLWVVKDGDTTIYLFGTVHVLKPGLTWFDEAVKDAFDKSGEVRIEVPEPDPAALQATVVRLALNTSDPTVTERLPEDRRAAYNAALAEVGIPTGGFDHFDPWLSAVTLSVGLLPKYGYDPKSGAEKVIVAAAEAAHKPVTAFETAEEQLGFFDSQSQDSQMKLLIKTIDELPKQQAELDKMVASWAHGDAEALGDQLEESLGASPELEKALITDRNARWADWIAARMAQPGTVFVAVGAGHLAGPHSVQTFLAQHHLKAERVRY